LRAVGRSRIDPPQLCIERGRALLLQPIFERRAQRGIRRRIGEVPAVEQRPDIEAGTALQHRQLSSAPDRRERAER